MNQRNKCRITIIKENKKKHLEVSNNNFYSTTDNILPILLNIYKGHENLGESYSVVINKLRVYDHEYILDIDKGIIEYYKYYKYVGSIKIDLLNNLSEIEKEEVMYLIGFYNKTQSLDEDMNNKIEKFLFYDKTKERL